MKRLTLNQDSEIKVKDIYGKMHDCKDVPNEFYGCIRKLYDYENTRSDTNNALFVSKVKIKGEYKRLEKGQIENIIRELGKDIGIENCHPHRFRRTMATDALRAGMPIEQVSLMLGHEELTTTQIYARSDESDVYQAHQKYVR